MSPDHIPVDNQLDDRAIMTKNVGDGMPASAVGAKAPGTAEVKVAFPYLQNVQDSVGGSHISSLNLIRHLDRDRFEPVVFTDNPRGRVADLFLSEGIPFTAIDPTRTAPDRETNRPAGRLARTYRGLSQVWALARQLKRLGIGIVHSNDGRTHVFAGLAARLVGAKHVWHHRSDPTALGLRYVAPATAHHVVTVSHFVGPRPGLWSAAKKWTVVPSPFDTETPPPDRAACRRAMLEALDADPDTAVIGFFANFNLRKRPLAFVRAIAALRARGLDRPVMAPMFGKPHETSEDDIMRLAGELGVADVIRPMGFRHPPEPWLAGCDVLLVSSVREPFGRTLIEAMLLGTLVVAADSGGNPEAIDDRVNGHLVPPDDAEAMAARLAEVLQAPEAMAHMTAHAQAEAHTRFGMQRHAQAIMRIYDAVLEGRGRPEALMAPEAQS